MRFRCDQCKSVLNSDAVTDGMKVPCPVCGVEIVCHPYGEQSKLSKVSTAGGTAGAEETWKISKVDDTVADHMPARLSSYFNLGFSKASSEIGERPLPFLMVV